MYVDPLHVCLTIKIDVIQLYYPTLILVWSSWKSRYSHYIPQPRNSTTDRTVRIFRLFEAPSFSVPRVDIDHALFRIDEVASSHEGIAEEEALILRG